MAIINWNANKDPWAEMRRVQGDMDRVWRSLWGTDDRSVCSTCLFPALNLSTDEKTVTVRAEMPGVALDKVDISIVHDTVTIKGERDLNQAGSEVSYHRRERRGGYFNRTVTLPYEVDPEKARATFTNGVLEVVVERAARSLPKKVSIQVG